MAKGKRSRESVSRGDAGNRLPASFRPRRRFAQHFLAPAWANKLVDAVAPQPGDVFVEIGPGAGALTLPLAAAGVPILGVELDRDLAAHLAARVPPHVTIVSSDFLTTDVVALVKGLAPQRPAPFEGGPGLPLQGGPGLPLQGGPGFPLQGGPGFPLQGGPGLQTGPRPAGSQDPALRTSYRLVGNLPYSITSPILVRIIELQRQSHFFVDATLMIQREVADRLAARAGTKAYGALTVMVQRRATVTRLLELPPGAFRPAPKVRSSVVRLTFDVSPPVVDEVAFSRLVKALFSQRRKTLANAVKRAHPRGPQALTASGLDPRRRPETLQVSEITRLAALITSPETPSL